MTYLLSQLLTSTAARQPAATAVESRGASITYAELDRQSTNLASLLRASGVCANDRVGIYNAKSIESVVAIFGILKAGATYVPLDPSAPVKRIAFIVGNCGMRGIVTSGPRLGPLMAALDGASPIECAVLAEGAAPAPRPRAVHTWDVVTANQASEAPATTVIEDDLAYILYTSGSTGEPKGVMISHRASLAFVDWAHERFRVSAADRLSSHAPFHFDLSVFDVFAAVKAGATFVLVPEELSVFPVNLARFIEDQRISVWYSVPSVLVRLVLHGNLKSFRFASLRTILFAGEVFPTRYLRQLMTELPRPEFFNLYGPTETNVCTYLKVEPLPESQTEPISIGKACENTSTFVVNDRGDIAQPGETGELWVRGPTLMKGYWGLSERTARSLVPNPHQRLWPENAYRTGDMVREGPDGNYTFLGRRDNMIKSRGYRIELGEIETALYGHPDIEEAAVVAVPDEQISNIIKAVIVCREGARLTIGQVEAHCADRIPRYMVPGVIEFRSSLPKTSTGKADKALIVREHLAARPA